MNEGDWNTQLDPDRAFTSPLKEWPLQVLVGINDNFINRLKKFIKINITFSYIIIITKLLDR